MNKPIALCVFFIVFLILWVTILPVRQVASMPPNANLCVTPTPEPLWVEPVTSPTDLLTQTITVWLGNGEAITISSQSGTFTQTGNFASNYPAHIPIKLKLGKWHYLQVSGKVKRLVVGDCIYGNYPLRTSLDKNGKSLAIFQMPVGKLYLPIIFQPRGE
jgi:hypothetical protein